MPHMLFVGECASECRCRQYYFSVCIHNIGHIEGRCASGRYTCYFHMQPIQHLL